MNTQPSDSGEGRARPTGVREVVLRARGEGRCAFVPYLTMGYPDLESSVALLLALEEMGVDAVEVGIPFSDPVADGPTIQRTTDIALSQGTTLRRCLERLARTDAAGRPGVARVLFSYLNPLLAFGLESVVEAARAAGIGAAIVTDLVPEEAEDWIDVCGRGGFETCFLVASTSRDARLRLAVESTSGFLYCVSTLGVTGARKALDASARGLVERVRALDDLPVAVGFGISTPDDVRDVASFADGVVVGSALLNAIEGAEGPEEVVRRARGFVLPMLEAARG